MALEGLLTLLWFSLSESYEQLFDSLLKFSWARWSIYHDTINNIQRELGHTIRKNFCPVPVQM